MLLVRRLSPSSPSGNRASLTAPRALPRTSNGPSWKRRRCPRPLSGWLIPQRRTHIWTDSHLPGAAQRDVPFRPRTAPRSLPEIRNPDTTARRTRRWERRADARSTNFKSPASYTRSSELGSRVRMRPSGMPVPRRAHAVARAPPEPRTMCACDRSGDAAEPSEQ